MSGLKVPLQKSAHLRGLLPLRVGNLLLGSLCGLQRPKEPPSRSVCYACATLVCTLGCRSGGQVEFLAGMFLDSLAAVRVRLKRSAWTLLNLVALQFWEQNRHITGGLKPATLRRRRAGLPKSFPSPPAHFGTMLGPNEPCWAPSKPCRTARSVALVGAVVLDPDGVPKALCEPCWALPVTLSEESCTPCRAQ